VVKHWHEQAHFKLRRKNRPDYYGLLGVAVVASEAEIKSAYKRKALILHPDKHSDSDEATQKTAEEEFKKIGEALEVLGDSMKRGLYDEGFDREAIEERIARCVMCDGILCLSKRIARSFVQTNANAAGTTPRNRDHYV
jgi:hypothetical protein